MILNDLQGHYGYSVPSIDGRFTKEENDLIRFSALNVRFTVRQKVG